MVTRARNLFLATSALIPLGIAAALANPLGSQVVGGSATVQGQGTSSVTVTQSTDKAIVNWNTFNIGAGETTSFVQPSASSVTLNRVTGGLGASTIDGSLFANGRIFLVNPDGLLIGRSGKIDAAGFLATTADIKNGDFMAGRYQFYTPGKAGASIVNLGTITAQTAGFAALVAPGVRNSGTITATLGSVGLASGNGFTLDFYGDKLITLQVGDAIATQVRDVATGRALDALVKNDGKIRANGGRVELTAAAARTIVDSVINTSGTIEANTFATRNGTIILGAATADATGARNPTQTVKVSGRLSAQGKHRGQTGGTVQITGEDIQLTNAKVNVSGRAGGGTALIGGDIGGGRGNPVATAALQQGPVPTASSVSIDGASTINASARDGGDGGKVVVWADKATSFYGTILSRAGVGFGNGGFVEVSGKERLAFQGTVDTSAANGKRGILLLDPQDITIGGTGTWEVSIANLLTALSFNDVAIVTGPGAGNGDITVAHSFSWGGPSSLTLAAFRHVTINSGVTIAQTGTGDLNIGAGLDTSGARWTSTGIGTINVLGTIDFRNSNGRIHFAYNPASGSYATPNNFANVLTNPSFVPSDAPPPPPPGSTPPPGVFPEPQFNPNMWVNNVTDLQNIRTNLAGFYILTSIDASGSASLNGGTGFVPIGDLNNPFTGRLVGIDNPASSNTIHGRITGLTINSTAASTLPAVGLFGAIGPGGAITDVALDATITSSAPQGIVGGLAGANFGSIFNSSVSGSINATGAASIVGGIAGMNFGNLAMTSSSAAVRGGGTTSGDFAAIGGLAGINAGSIFASSASGAVTITGATSGGFAGGLVGFNVGTGLSPSAGQGVILSSYATGAVSAPIGATQPVALGGLVGDNSGAIFDAYATGRITGPPPSPAAALGGLVGVAESGSTVTNGFFDLNTTGISTGGPGRGTPLTTAQLTANLASLNFTSPPWGISPAVNSGYPHLLPPLGDTNLTPTLLLPTIGTVTNPTPTPDPPPSPPPNIVPPPTPPSPEPNPLPVTNAVAGQQQQQANLAPPPPPGGNGQNSNSALPDTSAPASSGSNSAGTGPAPTGTAGTTGPTTAAPPRPPRAVIGPNGERFSSMPPPGETRFINNEVVLQVNTGITADQIAALTRDFGLTVLNFQTLDSSGQLAYRIQLPPGRTVREAIAALEANRIVAIAQPNYVFTLTQSSATPASVGMTRAADPAQYSARKLQLQAAHQISSGNNVLVAVIDSGIDFDHPGLKGTVAGRFEVVGRDEPPHAHGTAMAGAIVERGRLIGIAPNAKILAIRAFSEANNTAEGTSFAIVKSIDWAVGQGARVINMSFAGPRDPALERALKTARDKGVVLVAAAGNAGPKSPPLYPGADPNVIAVTALDAEDRLFKGANQGGHIAIAAPGVDVVSSAPRAVYQLSTGTSIATAHVSGVVALLLERDPKLTPANVQTLLTSTAKDLGPKGRDNQFGYGLVDPPRALMALGARTAVTQPPATTPR